MDSTNNSRSLFTDVNGQKVYIEGITRYTTCDDVIEMVFYNCPVDTESYALFESSYGVERMLYGKESVLKMMRSWGTDQNNFALLVRKVDNVKSKMATLSQARRKLRKIRSMNANALALKADNRTITEENLNKTFVKASNTKDIDNATEVRNSDNKYAKLGLLKRFLSDVMLQKKKRSDKQSRSRLGIRTSGDGCYDNGEQNGQQPPVGVLRRHNSYLNAAFVENDDTANSDGIDNDMSDSENTDSDYEVDLEDDSICELERNICDMSESDNDSDSSTDDDEGPFCNSENTVVKCERIIDIFMKMELEDNEAESEDDHMESFMKTFVDFCDCNGEVVSVESIRNEIAILEI